jgi:hypothetical protein
MMMMMMVVRDCMNIITRLACRNTARNVGLIVTVWWHKVCLMCAGRYLIVCRLVSYPLAPCQCEA